MDGFLGIIGILALAFGALLVGAGIVDAEPANTYFGASLVGSGVGFLAISTVIKVLKEIRDAIVANAKK
jgi:hypothetical protein